MEWVILFVISWVVFIFLVDLKNFKINFWCGVLAMALQLGVDSQAVSHKLYKITDPVICVWGSSFFFVIGPVFVIGTLLAQYHPAKKWMMLFNIIVISGLYSIQELLLIFSDRLLYINWHFINSVFVNVCAVTVMSWFSIVILNKGAERNL